MALEVAVLLLIAVAIALYVPSFRIHILHKAVIIANNQLSYDIDLDQLYLSPFHQHPTLLYRAYKGKEDLPVEVQIDNLFIGHRGQDTLVYVQALQLNAKLLTSHSDNGLAGGAGFTSIPIIVDTVRLDQVTFHSDSLIAAVGVDVVLSELALSSPQLLIAQGQYPLHSLRISDAEVGIDLRPTAPDTAVQDTTPLLLAFDITEGLLRNIHYRMTPLGMDIRTDQLATDVLVDVGANLYDAHRLDASQLTFSLNQLYIPADTLYGGAYVDIAHDIITTEGLHARSSEMGATLDLATSALDLATMRVDLTADAEYQGSQARVRGFYDIDDEAYDIQANIGRVNLSAFLPDNPRVILAGDLQAAGKGLDPNSKAMRANVQMHLTDAVYENINVSGLNLEAALADKTVTGNLHLPVVMNDTALPLRAQTEHQFSVHDFMKPNRMTVDYHAQIRDLHTRVAGEKIHADSLFVDFTTDSTTAVALATRNLSVSASAPMQVMPFIDELQPLLKVVSDSAVLQAITSLSDLTLLDTIRQRIPALQADIALHKGSPLQPFIDSTGIDLQSVALALRSDTDRTNIMLDAATYEQPTLPAIEASLGVDMTDGRTNASLLATSHIVDLTTDTNELCTDATLRMDISRNENALYGDGRLTLDSLMYGPTNLGNHAVDMHITPSSLYANALKADIQLDDIPLDIAEAFLDLPDIAMRGAVRASASIDGLPHQTDISAEVQPVGVSAEYKPYDIAIGLGETPIVMSHNHIDLNGLPIYAADSTFIALSGGLDLDSMRLDITLAADSFAPVKLPQDGPLPVYGELATDIRGHVTGPMDSILADVDITLLPVTDITYPIDKKNLAQVKPHGTVNVRYGTADGALDLDGRINVDSGFIRYSPKIYPIMPFHVDSGSHITFHGPLGQTHLDVSASQKVKANIQSEGEQVRSVDFTTGVRVQGVLDSIDLGAIGFFLEAPKDEVVSEELASLDEDRREELAAVLLATGMYMGESNVAAQHDGYALTSIINSRIDASMTNSKRGKVVDINISSSENERATGTANDIGVSLSKSFFHDRFKITVGASIMDNPEASNAVGLYGMAAGEYKLTKDGNILLRAFTQRDYNNILEGDLQKSGIGLRVTHDWKKNELYRSDSITRTYGIVADADVAYRSNNSVGPNISLKSSIRNLMGHNETFSVKGYGAYYWTLRERNPGDPKRSDTYKLGVDAALIFPYLHWATDDKPDGDTRYRVGYGYENIAGGYGVHKISGALTYFFRSPRSKFVTHAFTPFSLSIVHMKAESDSLIRRAADNPQLLKLLASDEFVPAVGYEFTYNNYRSKRPVNTMIDLEFKEAGNLINTIYCAFGYNWNTKNKPFGHITFNQFVKLTAELHNKFNLTNPVCIATRLYAGANIPIGNSNSSPLSEGLYTGGPNSLRASAPYAYGPGNFHSFKYSQNFFHAGDVKLEANVELRFPIVWKLFGAFFVDAGNVWNWYNSSEDMTEADYQSYLNWMDIHDELYDGLLRNKYLAQQIALGTGTGLRLDIEGLVIRLDLGVAIHAPYQTFKYKDGKPDYDRPIKTYYNLPNAWQSLRLNFGIGYPF